MTYKVDKNIPIKARGKTKYPLLDMEIGDSFLIAEEERGRISSSINMHVKQHGGKFVTRKVEDGVRVWRTE